jgi:hypothetical protein
MHDGYHPHWQPEMLFDISTDPHETDDLAAAEPLLVGEAAHLLDDWTQQQLSLALGDQRDPMDIVLEEGGPYHIRGHLPAYLERLRDSGRGGWADVLVERHGSDASHDDS